MHQRQKRVVEANQIRVDDQKDYREFLELEKTLESKLKGSQQRQAQRQQHTLAQRIGKDKPRGLFTDRMKAAVAKVQRTQSHTRGGLER